MNDYMIEYEWAYGDGRTSGGVWYALSYVSPTAAKAAFALAFPTHRIVAVTRLGTNGGGTGHPE